MVSQPLDITNRLPTTEELPCSDDTPVDDEDQNLLPNLLLLSLASLWSERMDWFFAVDMAVYHTTGLNARVPVVPDGFLSLGVPRRRGGKSRKSYAVWEEDEIVPTLTLEMVSHRYNGEYEEKLDLYARLGVRYSVIYNPEYWRRDRHQPFEIYRLENGVYQLQIGEPFWMAEVGLGLGRGRQVVGGIEQEVLLWHDAQGRPYPLSEQVIREMQEQLSAERQQLRIERQQLREAQQRAERLAEYLRSIGVDPDSI